MAGATAQQGVPAVSVGGAAAADARARVFVAESDSWQVQGGGGGLGGSFGASSAGGARPQTAEVIKTVGQRCPGVVVNNRLEASDYVLRVEHEGGKPMIAHKDKAAVFARASGDSIFAGSTRSVGTAVQDACAAIEAHWAAHAKEMASMTAAASTSGRVGEGSPETGAPAARAPVVGVPGHEMAGLTVDADVRDCSIEVDGEYVGSTPSTLSVVAGQHTIAVKKKGYADWSRTMAVAGSAVRVVAEMKTMGTAK